MAHSIGISKIISTHSTYLIICHNSVNWNPSLQTIHTFVIITGNKAETFTKEPITKNDTWRFHHTNIVNGTTTTNITLSIDLLNVTKLHSTGNYRYNRIIIKNHKRSRTKRQTKDEKEGFSSQTLSSAWPLFAQTVVTERIQINEDKAITIENYDGRESRKSTDATNQPDVIYKNNNFKNTTAANNIKTNDKISKKNVTTMKPYSLVRGNITTLNTSNGRSDVPQSEKLRRESSTCGAR